MDNLKKGSRGDHVKQLQENLVRLGYEIAADGIFGDGTDKAVRQLQGAFGYTVDGIVGEGTQKLIQQQIGLNWNARSAAGQAAPGTKT